jgi:AcrR family transcriptional regulator
MRAEHGSDRRVQRTQRLLRDALVSLIHEKSYDAIVVKEILARANVGRSAFYAHFHDKDALLASGIQEMLRATPPRPLPSSARRFEKALWFSLPVFEHVNRFRHSADAKMGRRERTLIHEHLRHVLTELIADDLEAELQRPDGYAIPADLLVEYVVATFVLVLNWWVESRSPLPPCEVDDVFLSIVRPTLAAATGAPMR